MNEIPKNLEAEQAILGAILIDEKLIVNASDALKEDDFYDPKNRIIFRAMIGLMQMDSHIDITTISAWLNTNNLYNEAGGLEYLSSLYDSTYSTLNIDTYIGLVSNASLKRNTINSLNELAQKGYDGKVSAFDFIENIERVVFELSSRRKVGDFQNIINLSNTVLDNINIRHNMTGDITGLDTGFYSLNHLTNGFQPGALIILAARPAMGKSAMALNLAYNVAKNNKNGTAGVAIFSLEMTSEQLVERMLSSVSEVPLGNIVTGKFDIDAGYNIKQIQRAADNLKKYNLYFDDTASITVSNMRAKCRKLAAEGKLDFIVVDYLQLITDDSGRKSTQEEVARISRGLKLMAKELNVPVLALSQLSRSVEQRKDGNGAASKKPQLSDLRDSGSIEQDADIVMFLYREDYYNKDSPRVGEADLIVAKNRQGAVSSGLPFNFRGELVKFTPITRQQTNNNE